MTALDLGACLTKVENGENTTIDFIELYEGNDDFLQNACKEIDKHLVFDLDRTLAQPDMCNDQNKTFYMYPSTCNDKWPGEGCLKTCNEKNYDGFYCKRKKLYINEKIQL